MQAKTLKLKQKNKGCIIKQMFCFCLAVLCIYVIIFLMSASLNDEISL